MFYADIDYAINTNAHHLPKFIFGKSIERVGEENMKFCWATFGCKFVHFTGDVSRSIV